MTADMHPVTAWVPGDGSAFPQAGVLDGIAALSSAIVDKSWVSGDLAGVVMGADMLPPTPDPRATLISWGMGWVFDLIAPLKGWLIELAGDADQLRTHGRTWRNVGALLEATAHNIDDDVRLSFPDGAFAGSAVTSYLAASGATTRGIGMTGELSRAVGTAYDVCAVIIQFVYDFVRDAINQVVEAITPYAVELTSSFVTAFPLVMAQIASSVGALIEGVAARIIALKESLSNLGVKLSGADQLLKSLKEWLHNLSHDGEPMGGPFAMA